jgi:hypothetical protein
MPVSVQTDYHKYPTSIQQHLIQRFRDRRFTAGMAQELADWLKTRPVAPSLQESPAGWHKKFVSFTVCGEGEFIKTVFTIYAPGTPRKNSVDLSY